MDKSKPEKGMSIPIFSFGAKFTLYILVLVLILMSYFLWATVVDSQDKLRVPIVLSVFLIGSLGGSISIISRQLNKDEYWVINSAKKSFLSTIVVPSMVSGIFAIIFMLMIQSGLVAGHIFPKYNSHITSLLTDRSAIIKIISNLYPATYQDLAKLFFWSFAAGFSERLVPGMVKNLTGHVDSKTADADNKTEDR